MVVIDTEIGAVSIKHLLFGQTQQSLPFIIADVCVRYKLIVSEMVSA
jgi:hypothetical protein